MLADLTQMESISPGGVMQDVKLAISRLGDLTTFDRVAVLADGGVLRALSKTGGALIPGVDVKLFEPGERQRALEWLAQPVATG